MMKHYFVNRQCLPPRLRQEKTRFPDLPILSHDYEVVFCVVNAGYSELVMDAAKEVGARGGTVIHACLPPRLRQEKTRFPDLPILSQPACKRHAKVPEAEP